MELDRDEVSSRRRPASTERRKVIRHNSDISAPRKKLSPCPVTPCRKKRHIKVVVNRSSSASSASIKDMAAAVQQVIKRVEHIGSEKKKSQSERGSEYRRSNSNSPRRTKARLLQQIRTLKETDCSSDRVGIPMLNLTPSGAVETVGENSRHYDEIHRQESPAKRRLCQKDEEHQNITPQSQRRHYQNITPQSPRRHSPYTPQSPRRQSPNIIQQSPRGHSRQGLRSSLAKQQHSGGKDDELPTRYSPPPSHSEITKILLNDEHTERTTRTIAISECTTRSPRHRSRHVTRPKTRLQATLLDSSPTREQIERQLNRSHRVHNSPKTITVDGGIQASEQNPSVVTPRRGRESMNVNLPLLSLPFRDTDRCSPGRSRERDPPPLIDDFCRRASIDTESQEARSPPVRVLSQDNLAEVSRALVAGKLSRPASCGIAQTESQKVVDGTTRTRRITVGELKSSVDIYPIKKVCGTKASAQSNAMKQLQLNVDLVAPRTPVLSPKKPTPSRRTPQKSPSRLVWSTGYSPASENFETESYYDDDLVLSDRDRRKRFLGSLMTRDR